MSKREYLGPNAVGVHVGLEVDNHGDLFSHEVTDDETLKAIMDEVHNRAMLGFDKKKDVWPVGEIPIHLVVQMKRDWEREAYKHMSWRTYRQIRFNSGDYDRFLQRKNSHRKVPIVFGYSK